MRELLSAKTVDVNAADYGSRTAMHVAASQGNTEMIECLCSFNADVNALDNWQASPIDDAIRKGFSEVAMLLAKHGGKVGNQEAADASLLKAVLKGEREVVELLLLAGADPNAHQYDSRSVLHIAVSKGHDEIADLLISSGARMDVKDDFGYTPLDEAERHSARLGNDKMVGLLISRGAVRDTQHQIPPRFALIFGIVQVIILILYGVGVRYSDALFSSEATDGMEVYPWFQDVHVMIFVGFGFLMTFLRRYAYSAVCLTMLVAVMCIQWYILVSGVVDQVINRPAGGYHAIKVDMVSLVLGDFSAGAVLISFGALLGKVSPIQLLCLAMLEIVVFCLNEAIAIEMGVADVGGSIVVHAFGAYFGLAASFVLTPVRARGDNENTSTYHADVFSTIGTVFLWLFWPSFNGALAGVAQQRVVCNTVLSLIGSAMGTFVFSQYLRGGKFYMVDIQNATLAGGVAIGSTANFAVHPPGALTIGFLAGILSVLGYVKIQAFLEDKLKIYDTCGVNNLHGMPAIFAALLSVVYSLYSTADVYQCTSLEDADCQVSAVWGARSGASPRSPLSQALTQLAFLGMTLAIATTGGLLVGFIVRFISPMTSGFFLDSQYFAVPELETPFYFDKRSEGNREKMEHAAMKIRQVLPTTKFQVRPSADADGEDEQDEQLLSTVQEVNGDGAV